VLLDVEAEGLIMTCAWSDVIMIPFSGCLIMSFTAPNALRTHKKTQLLSASREIWVDLFVYIIIFFLDAIIYFITYQSLIRR
jgi:hypothetical protein